MEKFKLKTSKIKHVDQMRNDLEERAKEAQETQEAGQRDFENAKDADRDRVNNEWCERNKYIKMKEKEISQKLMEQRAQARDNEQPLQNS